METPDNVKWVIDESHKKNLSKLSLFITVEQGLYQGITCEFEFNIPDNFPYKPPNVFCKTIIFHPNIVFNKNNPKNGSVITSLLCESWRPITSLEFVVLELIAALTVKYT